MSKIKYQDKRFSPDSALVIVQADSIIQAYQAQGLNLTLRQLYYRFVAGGLLPNQQREYKRLGTIINDARLAGLLDWDAIEDRGRSVNPITAWSNPADIIHSAASSYAIDLWDGQDYRVEVWVEKQALEAVIENAARALATPSLACKGYLSQSEMWRAAQRMQQWERLGYQTVIIHLGDHDPSGIDMTRDTADRLHLFKVNVTVNRIALNMNQITQYNPPPNPAKMTDTRAGNYVANYGHSSWELDALDPATLHTLIQNEIKKYLDASKYNAKVQQQEDERKLLTSVARKWNTVASHVEDLEEA